MSLYLGHPPQQLPVSLFPTDSEIILPSRTLAKAKDIEIENAWEIDPRLIEYLRGRFLNTWGCQIDASTARSLYFDTTDLALFSSGLTLRDRLRGTSACGEVYKDEMGLKFFHKVFQSTSDELVARLYGNEDLKGCAPIIRAEIERAVRPVRDASELRFDDLPKKIRAILTETIKGRNPKKLVLKPLFLTQVQRKKFSFFISPGALIDFGRHHPLAQPSRKMLSTNDYICIEMALDRVTYLAPQRGAIIDGIVSPRSLKREPLTPIGNTSVLEYEFKPKKSGARTTNEGIVEAFTNLGKTLLSADRALSEQKNGYVRMSPALSKAANGFGFLPQCQTGAASHHSYKLGCAAASALSPR